MYLNVYKENGKNMKDIAIYIVEKTYCKFTKQIIHKFKINKEEKNYIKVYRKLA